MPRYTNFHKICPTFLHYHSGPCFTKPPSPRVSRLHVDGKFLKRKATTTTAIMRLRIMATQFANWKFSPKIWLLTRLHFRAKILRQKGKDWCWQGRAGSSGSVVLPPAKVFPFKIPYTQIPLPVQVFPTLCHSFLTKGRRGREQELLARQDGRKIKEGEKLCSI